MLGRAALLAAGNRNLDFRTKTTFSASATATKPTGVAAGDIVFVLAVNCTAGVTLTTNSGAAWSRNQITGSTGVVGVIFSKVLVALDVTNAWDLSSSESGISARYQGNGVASASVKSTTSNGLGATTLALTGFTPAAGSRGAVAAIMDADTGATDAAPTGFTSRHKATTGTVEVNLTDQVSGYSGGTVTFTSTGPNEPEFGWLIEAI